MKPELTVRDIMSPTKKSISCDDSITVAAKKLIELDLQGLPVVNSAGKLVGMLTEHDCVNHLLASGYFLDEKDSVGDVMFAPVLTVSPDMLVVELASQMRQGKPKYYPVIDADEKLIGEVNRHQVLAALLS